jgi:hypothetical protein
MGDAPVGGLSEPSKPSFDEGALVSLIKWHWLPCQLANVHNGNESAASVLILRIKGEWIDR